jgi:hypothetical protein
MAAGRLSSYRFRRRLAWTATWTAFAVSAVVVGVVFWNTADAKETFSNEPAQVYVAPRAITLTGADKSEIGQIARRFVRTAVARNHPEEAYALVGPLLRGELSRNDWKTGNIPVAPYPVDEARWKFDYATEIEVGLSVLLFPRPGEQVRPTVFNMALAPREDSWLITAWSPKGGTPATAPTSASPTPEEAIAAAVDPPPRVAAKADAKWLLVPFAILLVALAFPFVWMARENRRGRGRRRLHGRSP